MDLRLGVIGTGYLGSRRAEKITRLERAVLAGVYDRDPTCSAEVAARIGCRQFLQLEALLEAVDAAVVAVPARQHEWVASRVLEAGLPVLVEKPLAVTVEEAARLVRLAKERGVVLQVGHVERFNPAFEAIAGQVTRPRFIEVQRLNPFVPRGLDLDVVLEVMIHDLELVLALMNQPVVDVEAVGVPVLSSSSDIANARLTFADGCVASLTANRVSNVRERRLRIFQAGECLSVDLDTREVTQMARCPEGGDLRIETRPISSSSGDALSREIQAFVNAVVFCKLPRVDGEAGLAALELAHWVLRAVRTAQGAA